MDNPPDKSKFHYTFGSWFYDYSGKRFAYTPLGVPVVRNMNVFAAWGSLTAQPCRIHYALDEAETQSERQDLLAAVSAPLNNTYTVTNGTEVRRYVYLASDKKFHLCIADDTDDFAYQGSTRTFAPKAGDPYNLSERYHKLQQGYYPTLANHSITMEYEENKEDPSKNVFTFTCMHKLSVDYTVKYRYADTNALIESVADKGKALKSTQDGVITERLRLKTIFPMLF